MCGLADRVGGRTMSRDIPAAGGTDRWDFGGQWVGRWSSWVCVFWLVLRQVPPVWLKWSICSSTQTQILELINELGLETYPQYNVGKKVYHTGGPGAKIHTYTSAIPALSPLVMMDFMQMLWKVRQGPTSRRSLVRSRSTKKKCNDVKQWNENEQRGDADWSHTQIERLCATVCVEDPSTTPDAVRLDSMTFHSYIEKHAWTAGEHFLFPFINIYVNTCAELRYFI